MNEQEAKKTVKKILKYVVALTDEYSGEAEEILNEKWDFLED